MSVLDTAASAASVLSPSIIVRTVRSLATVVKGAFGQLATRLFWIDLGKLVIKTMVNAFILTIGGKFVSYGRSQEPAPAAAAAASSAFSNGYTPRQDYGQRTDFRTYGQAAAQPVASANFPGW